ncbi:membrane protein [Phytohabitans houttuyneae]
MFVIERATRRLTQLFAGLVLYGASMALMIESRLGLDPWDVFHQGLSEVTGLRFGLVVILVGAAVLLLWIPLRQRPGIGTVANVVVIGLAVDAVLLVLPTAGPLAARIAYLVGGVVLNGVATGLYIGARLGPGPRDGLMTGFVARRQQGWRGPAGPPSSNSRPRGSIRVVRTVIEVTVLAVGWLLGGTVGIGTVLYAVAIGPLAHVFIPLFTVPERPGPDSARLSAREGGRHREAALSACGAGQHREAGEAARPTAMPVPFGREAG